MKKVILVLLLTTIAINSYSSIKLDDTIYTKLVFDKSTDIKNIFYSCYEDEMYVFEQNVQSNSTDIYITQLNITNGAIVNIDTIAGLPTFFKIKDLIISPAFIMLISFDEYFYYEKGKLNSTGYYNNKKDNSLTYKHAELLNDSLVLLYYLYNFHPLDGDAGLHLSVLNTNTKEIESTKFIEFPTIYLSHISNSWLTVVNNAICVVSPLTGTFQFYDYSLNLLNESKPDIDVISRNLNKNQLKVKYYDSIYRSEKDRFEKLLDIYGRDSVDFYKEKFESEIYSKSFIWNTIKTIRSESVFIERVFSINDTTIGISISRPGYEYAYRDLYLYTITNNLVTKYGKLNTLLNDTVEYIEDYYPVDIKLDKSKFPYFYDGDIYAYTFFKPSFFIPGPQSDISKLVLKDIYNHGYQFIILKYSMFSNGK